MSGCLWVEDVALAEVPHSSRQGKSLSVASPSSVGLEKGASVASSVATKSVFAVGLSDASVVVSLVIGRGSVVLALQVLVTTLRLLALALRSLVRLAVEAALRPSSPVLRCPRVRPRLWTTHPCV